MAKKEPKYCEICGEEITGKSLKLTTGEWVCDDCLEESNEIVKCEDCGKWNWAKNTVRKDGDGFCKICMNKRIENIMKEYVNTLAVWNKGCEEDGIATLDAVQYAVKFGDPETLEAYYEGIFGTRYELRTAADKIAAGWGC